MKAISINGSSRPAGNTHLILKIIIDILSENGINSEMINLADYELKPCMACFACKGKEACIKVSDDFNPIFDKMKLADIIILGSPVYSSDVSAKMKLLLDRSAVVAATNQALFKHKIGVSVAAVRRAGGMVAIDTMNHFFLNKEMIVVGSTYWNMVYGNKIGEVLDDAEGIKNMRNLAENLIWLTKRIDIKD